MLFFFGYILQILIILIVFEIRHHQKCYCVCVGLENKMHMFREYFLSLTAIKITERVELTKMVTGKTSAILCGPYDNCLEQQICILELSNQVLNFCVLKI